jgi:hypothetical protein
MVVCQLRARWVGVRLVGLVNFVERFMTLCEDVAGGVEGT